MKQLNQVLEFAKGSLGTVTYVANGDKNFGKNASRSLEAACPLGWTTTGKLSVR